MNHHLLANAIREFKSQRFKCALGINFSSVIYINFYTGFVFATSSHQCFNNQSNLHNIYWQKTY